MMTPVLGQENLNLTFLSGMGETIDHLLPLFSLSFVMVKSFPEFQVHEVRSSLRRRLDWVCFRVHGSPVPAGA